MTAALPASESIGVGAIQDRAVWAVMVRRTLAYFGNFLARQRQSRAEEVLRFSTQSFGSCRDFDIGPQRVTGRIQHFKIARTILVRTQSAAGNSGVLVAVNAVSPPSQMVTSALELTIGSAVTMISNEPDRLTQPAAFVSTTLKV